MGFVSAIEPLRVANRFRAQSYRWHIVSCTGGPAAIDMMLALIGRKHGRDLAAAVSEQFVLGRIRSQSDHQRMEIAGRYGVHNRKTIQIIKLMQEHIEDPLPADDLGRHDSRDAAPAGASVLDPFTHYTVALLHRCTAGSGARTAAANRHGRHGRGRGLRIRFVVPFCPCLPRAFWSEPQGRPLPGPREWVARATGLKPRVADPTIAGKGLNTRAPRAPRQGNLRGFRLTRLVHKR